MCKVPIWVVILLCAAIGLGIANKAEAQVVKGSISGTVVDQSGASVPAASIKATEESTGAVYTTTSGENGDFRLSLMSVGTYDLQFTKEGFKTLTIPSVGVSSSVDSGLGGVKLQVGEVSTTVEVTGAPAILETSQAQVTTNVPQNIIQHFPGVEANQGLDILALQIPGVVNARDNNFSNANGMGFQVNGLRGRSNDQQIDGQNNNDNSVTGPYLFEGNPDFVQEYQVVTDNFGAEYGRNAGSVVNIITKSGSNNFHGDAFITETDSSLQTLTNTQKAFEGLTKVPYYNQQFSSVNVGGPIIKDKLFFFGGIDNEILNQSTVSSTGSLTPTPAGLTELASCPWVNPTALSILNQYGPFGVKGGNPTVSGSPVVRTFTDPNNPASPSCQIQMGGVERAFADPFKQYDGIAKLDWNGVKDRISGRWMYQKSNNVNVDEGQAAAGYPVNIPAFAEDFGASWTRNLTGMMVNEARISYGRETVEFGGNALGNTVPNQTAYNTALANINIPSPYLGFGPSTDFPDGRIVNTYQFQDNWNYIHGRHQFKAGYNFTYQRSPNVFLPDVNGEYSFSSFAGYLANTPSSISVALGSPVLDFREKDQFWYVGDDFKWKPNLTLNLGLTYSYFGQPANLFNTYTTKRESDPSTAFWNPQLPLSLRTFPAIPSVKSDFGPSLGFAYTPNWGGWLGDGKTVIRGGYRRAFDPPFYNIYLNINTASPVALLQTLTGATAAANPMIASPYGAAVRSSLSPFLTLGTFDPRQFSATTLTPNFGPDQVQSWSLGVQRELGQNIVLEARYVGNHGSDLFQSINANPYIAGIYADFPNVLPSGVAPCTDPTAFGYGRVDCDEGVIRKRTNTGVSDYNALQVNLRTTNIADQLTLNSSYTWSKTTDNVSEIFGTDGAGNTLAFSQNPLNYISAEHGTSGLDVPQSWTMSFFETLPFFKNQRGLTGHVLGGWSLSGVYILASGQPYTPVQFALNYGSGGNYNDTAFDTGFVGTYETSRPFVSNPAGPAGNIGMFAGDACNYFGSGCGLNPSTLLSFNNLNSKGVVSLAPASSVRFIVNAPEADVIFKTPFGSAGRNILRDAPQNIANFGIYKDIRISERFKTQFSVTATNVFNHPNFGASGCGGVGIDPFLDDGGLASECTGFANPTLFGGGFRQIIFGLKLFF